MTEVARQAPFFYANSFDIILNAADANIQFVCNGQSVIVVAMPYPLLRQLQKVAGDSIDLYERDAKTVVTPIKDLADRLNAKSNAGKN